MPVADTDLDESRPPTRLPFSPISRRHILNCSYHEWHPRYRHITPKARLIPLTDPFLEYLRADGIVLPDDEEPTLTAAEASLEAIGDSTEFGAGEADDDTNEAETASDPSAPWRPIHDAIHRTIKELGGKVAPKLNWSAPKDATWINPTNSMECRSPNDVYLLLKSSDFITHDLEHAFDGCVENEMSEILHDSPLQNGINRISYHLVLRKWIPLNPSVEFRCFVRRRLLIGMCQRDLSHYDFLSPMHDQLRDLIVAFFQKELLHTFPDDNFCFDVYIPNPYTRVWLMDINPWAPRTDPILFSWLELLTMPDPISKLDDLEEESTSGSESDLELPEGVVRIPFRPALGQTNIASQATVSGPGEAHATTVPGSNENSSNVSTSPISPSNAIYSESASLIELRLIHRHDPEATNFSTPQYSAHKLPRDVVDASAAAAEGHADYLKDFATQWREALDRKRRGEDVDSSDEE